jgi:hypothetical protein
MSTKASASAGDSASGCGPRWRSSSFGEHIETIWSAAIYRRYLLLLLILVFVSYCGQTSNQTKESGDESPHSKFQTGRHGKPGKLQVVSW